MIENFFNCIHLKLYIGNEKWLNVSSDSAGDIKAIVKEYLKSGKNKIRHSDLAIIRSMDSPEKQNFQSNIQYLKSCTKLTGLALSTVLADLDVLKDLDSRHLKFLSLYFLDKQIGGFKKSNKLDLSFVKQFMNLIHLELIPDSISPIIFRDCRLEKLINLTLNYYDLRKVEFDCFPNLESLQLYGKKINIEQFDAFRNGKLRYLGLSGLNSLKDLSFISELPNLQILSLNQINELESLPNLSTLDNLKYVFISRCKKLEDFTTLEYVPNLKGVNVIYQINKTFDIKNFKGIVNNTSLEQFYYAYNYQSKKEINELQQIFKERFKPMKSKLKLMENGAVIKS